MDVKKILKKIKEIENDVDSVISRLETIHPTAYNLLIDLIKEDLENNVVIPPECIIPFQSGTRYELELLNRYDSTHHKITLIENIMRPEHSLLSLYNCYQSIKKNNLEDTPLNHKFTEIFKETMSSSTFKQFLMLNNTSDESVLTHFIQGDRDVIKQLSAQFDEFNSRVLCNNSNNININVDDILSNNNHHHYKNNIDLTF